MRALVAVVVLLLNLWALMGAAALPARTERVRWIAIIVGLPLVGALLWARRGRGAVRT